jgi:hypothetical protein
MGRVDERHADGGPVNTFVQDRAADAPEAWAVLAPLSDTVDRVFWMIVVGCLGYTVSSLDLVDDVIQNVCGHFACPFWGSV